MSHILKPILDFGSNIDFDMVGDGPPKFKNALTEQSSKEKNATIIPPPLLVHHKVYWANSFDFVSNHSHHSSKLYNLVYFER